MKMFLNRNVQFDKVSYHLLIHDECTKYVHNPRQYQISDNLDDIVFLKKNKKKKEKQESKTN